jgi:ring-1,2-phenylacetyl-CoA epoxidase subunit PaaB
MPDTQWPQFIVFDQPKEGKPPFYAGAVHAPDPEMALLNARDVFARRDSHVNLWVVRESHIFAKTAEELSQEFSAGQDEALDNLEVYFVFQKTSHNGTLVQVGEVKAANPESAMAAALKSFSNPKAIVWWVFSARAAHQSDPAENETLFGPADDKPFRHSNFYPTVTLMREINLAKEKLNWDDE